MKNGSRPSKIYIGTSGYSYKDWVGPFYSPGTSPQDMLPIYSQHFSFTELNFSYYALPSPKTSRSMHERTPPEFRFTIKAHRSITHEIGTDWKESCKAFREGLAPLLESGKLLGTLCQFPFRFHYTPDNRRYLDELIDEMADLRPIIEFRNAQWQQESVLKEMRRRNLPLVITDNPSLPGLPYSWEEVTADLAYIRFHGRNRENWWTGNNVSRYDYLYSRKELINWLTPVQNVLSRAKILIVAFNNHSRGQAVKNAKEFRAILEASVE